MLGPRTGRENIHTLVRPRRALAKRGGVLGTSMGAVLPPWVPAPPLWAPTSLLWVLALGTTTWVPTPPVTSMGSSLRPWAPAPTPPWSSDPLPLPLWVLALGPLLAPPPPFPPGGGEGGGWGGGERGPPKKPPGGRPRPSTPPPTWHFRGPEELLSEARARARAPVQGPQRWFWGSPNALPPTPPRRFWGPGEL